MGRPKDEGSDNAMPSGSSVAIHTLQRLSQRSGELDYRKQTDGLIARFAPAIEASPISYGYLLTAVANHLDGELASKAYAGLGRIHITASSSKADQQTLLNLKIEIPKGWHINSDQPTDSSLVATHISLADNNRGWQMGPVTYPKAILKNLAFQQQPLSVYGGTIRLQSLLKQTIEDNIEVTTLPIDLKLQACNDQVCLPPESVTLWITIGE
jgi:DsbC/DsbD-like thiol-disulfide interchange protein